MGLKDSSPNINTQTLVVLAYRTGSTNQANAKYVIRYILQLQQNSIISYLVLDRIRQYHSIIVRRKTPDLKSAKVTSKVS